MYTGCVLGYLNTGYAYIWRPAPTLCQFQQLSTSKLAEEHWYPPPPPILLGMCRWPLSAPTPFKSILLLTIDPILVSFEQM